MAQRVSKKKVRQNRRKMFVAAWRKAEATGVSLEAFCYDYGITHKTLRDWLAKEHEPQKLG